MKENFICLLFTLLFFTSFVLPSFMIEAEKRHEETQNKLMAEELTKTTGEEWTAEKVRRLKPKIIINK